MKELKNVKTQLEEDIKSYADKIKSLEEQIVEMKNNITEKQLQMESDIVSALKKGISYSTTVTAAKNIYN